MTMICSRASPSAITPWRAAWYETYASGVRKATFADSDGNKIELGDAPA
jgi:hypothetical protein